MGNSVGKTATKNPASIPSGSLTDNNIVLWAWTSFVKDSGHSIDELFWKPEIKLVEETVKGGVLRCIDDAVGGVAVTGDNWIEDEKFWLYHNNVSAGSSAEFDTEVKRTGDKTLKLEITSSTGKAIVLNDNSNSDFTDQRIQAQANTTYLFWCWVKSDSVETNWIYLELREWADWVISWANESEKLSWSNDWTYLQVELETSAWADSLFIYFRMTAWGSSGQIWRFDINSMTLKQKWTTTNPGQSGVQSIVWSVKWKSTTNNIDQEAIVSNNWNPLYAWQTIWQVFSPTKENLSAIMFRCSSVNWSWWWNITIDLYEWDTDYATTKSWSIIASNSLVWTSWTNHIVDMVAMLDTANQYFYELSADWWDASNSYTIRKDTSWWYAWWSIYINWSSLSQCAYFATYYTKNTIWVTIEAHNKILSLKSNTSDGILDWATIDLVNSKYSHLLQDWDSNKWLTDANDIDGVKLHTGSWDRLLFTSVNDFIVYKHDFLWLPATNIKVMLSITWISWNEKIDIQYSTDGSSYILLQTFDASSNNVRQYIDIPVTGNFVYIKINNTNNSFKYVNEINLTADIDTSAIIIPKSYPTGSTETETLLWLPLDATTSLTYREDKYGFPAVEFADWDYLFLPMDVRDASTCIITAYDETGMQVATWDFDTDWDSVTIVSNDKVFMVFDFILTQNSYYISSDDIFADAWKDWSMQTIVNILKKSQWLYYDVLELKNNQ